MFETRTVLVHLRRGDSGQAIARTGLIGRNKLRRFRVLADQHGWLDPAWNWKVMLQVRFYLIQLQGDCLTRSKINHINFFLHSYRLIRFLLFFVGQTLLGLFEILPHYIV